MSIKVIAQQTSIVLLDTITSKPISYANIIVYPMGDYDNKKGYTTDINGKADININAKSVFSLTCVGYMNNTDTIFPGDTKTKYIIPITYNVDEVVVTGQYCVSTQDKSIYKVSVISTQELKNRAATNLRDALSTQLDIRTSQDNSLGSSITMQGMSGEHVKILVDGIPVIGRENGNIDMDQINLQNADHIEIINGPMSVIYGSNALAGAINIITKVPDRLKFSSKLDMYYESVGNYNVNLDASATIKRSSFSFSGGRNFFDGFEPPGTSWEERWKPKEQWNFSGDYKYRLNKGYIKLGGSYFHQELRDNGQLLPPYYEYRYDKIYFTNRAVLRSDFNYNLSSKSAIKGVLSYSGYDKIKNTYKNDLTELEKTISTRQQDTTSFSDIMFRADYNNTVLNDKFKYLFGIDLNNSVGTGKRIEKNEQSIGDYSTYLILNYTPISVLSIQPGVRFIYNTKFDAPIVYSVNIKYDILERLLVRASIASGFRAPSLKEMYLNFVDVNHDIHGNTNLSSETSISTNLFIQYQSLPYHEYVWGLELNVFNNNIKNNIQLVPVGNQSLIWSYVNVNKYITRGFELNFNNNIYPWLQVKFGYSLTGKIMEYQMYDSGKTKYNSDFNTQVTMDINRWEANISAYYKYNGTYPQLYFTEVDQQPGIEWVDSYNTLDITIGKWFYKRRIYLQTGGKNLFNNTNIGITGASQGGIHSGSNNTVAVNWGRTFFVRLQIRINK